MRIFIVFFKLKFCLMILKKESNWFQAFYISIGTVRDFFCNDKNFLYFCIDFMKWHWKITK